VTFCYFRVTIGTIRRKLTPKMGKQADLQYGFESFST
jgi:hypothetical protein